MLKVHNTLSGKVEDFTPITPGHVRMYVCGVTVYDRSHIGHARALVTFDVIFRYLTFAGYEVNFVRNLTDVDDKIIQRAQQRGISADDVANANIESFQQDMKLLGCQAPSLEPRATDHVDEMIELIRQLEEKGLAYPAHGDVYFAVDRFEGYGKLSKRRLDDMMAGARIEVDERKHHPMDFALWKASKPDEPAWDSPWGRGRPGWHIECSAMSSKYLGQQFDIHTGGIDHLTVHHTNEIAQSECAFEVHPWVQVWMQNEWLDFRGRKMSKSLGNVYLLDDLVADGHPPLAFRYFFLQAHYRKQQTFNDEAMEAAATGYRRLLASAVEVRAAEGEADPKQVEPHRARFREAVRDDLNAPQALAVASEVARDRGLSAADRRTLLLEFDEWLGLDLATATLPEEAQESDPRIDALVAKREEARASKDWAEADRIREALTAEGVVIDDTPEGPRWRRR